MDRLSISIYCSTVSCLTLLVPARGWASSGGGLIPILAAMGAYGLVAYALIIFGSAKLKMRCLAGKDQMPFTLSGPAWKAAFVP